MRKKLVSALVSLVVPALMCGCGRGALEDFAGSGCQAGEVLISEEDGDAEPAGAGQSAAKEDLPAVLCVDISGAVKNPGVYVLPEGSRVIDAVAAASGLMPEADLKRINQAKGLTDGEKIIVYAVGEDAAVTDSGTGGTGPEGSVNINTADLSELRTLSGIGEVKARAIVEDREKNGAFLKPGDIMRVTGIGEKLFDRIRGEITV